MQGGRLRVGVWLLIIVVVAVALLYVLLGKGEKGAVTANAAPSTTAVVVPVPLPDTAPPQLTDTAPAPLAAGRIDRVASSRVETESNTHDLQVQVVVGAYGSGIAEAQGYWMPLGKPVKDQALSWELDGTDVEALVRAQGVAFRTDEHGIARCRVPNHPIVVVARTGEQYAESFRPLTTEPDEVELHMFPDASLEVFVHSKAGDAVVGFPLAFLQVHDQWTSSLSVARSDSSGIARFRNLGRHLPLDSDGVRLILRAAAPFLDAQEIEVDLEAWPQNTLDYTVGQYGSLTLRLQNHDGSPRLTATGCAVQIQGGEQGFWRRIQGFQPREGLGVARRIAHDGEAHFPFIGLGLNLEVVAWMDTSHRPFEIQVRGPVQPGENVEAVLWIEKLRPVVRFRVVDSDGQPIRDQAIECLGTFKGASFSAGLRPNLRTNEDGVIDFIMTFPAGEDAPGELTLDLSLERGSTVLRHVLELPKKLRPGIQDIGDIPLLEEPLLASGRVIDAQGVAVAQATLLLNAATEEGMMPVADYYYSADADGTFLIRGSTTATELFLHASRGGELEKVISIPVGAEGLEIQLDPGYRIAGRVLTDEDILATRLEVRVAPAFSLRGTDGEDGSINWQRTRPAADGSFAMLVTTIEPVTVVVTVRGTDAVLAWFDSVLPVGEGGVDDSRLATIDLRGKLSRFTLRFLDSTGVPVGAVELTIPGMPSIFDQDSLSLYLWGGQETFFLPTKAFSFKAVGEGQRQISGQVPAPGEHTFHMEPGLPARVRILPTGSLPSGVRVVLDVSPIGWRGGSD